MTRRILIGILALVVLGAGSFLGYGYLSRQGAPSFSKGGEFGVASSPTPTESPSVKGTRTERAAEPDGARATAEATNESRSTGPARVSGPAGATGATIARPRAGHYTFAGTGSEQVRFGPTSACSWNVDDVTLDIKRSSDGTVFDWAYSSQRMERLLFDYDPEGVHLTFAGSAVTCLGVRRTSQEDYRPPSTWVRAPLRVGTSWRQRTTAGERQEDVRTEVLRRERVRVPAGRFDAHVLHSWGTLEGSEEGTFDVMHWFVPELGMSVKKKVETAVVSGSAQFESNFTIKLRSLP